MEKQKYTHRFVPLCARGEKADFEGEITLYVPTTAEQMLINDVEYDMEMFQEQIGRSIDEEEAKAAGKELPKEPEKKLSSRDAKIKKRIEDMRNTQKLMKGLAVVMQRIDPFIKEVKIKHKESGTQFSSWDELSHDPLARTVCLEVTAMFQRGFAPSKNS